MAVALGAAAARASGPSQSPPFAVQGSGAAHLHLPALVASPQSSANAPAAAAQASLLSPVSTFGSGGSGAGQLNSPTGVAIQPSSGNVFVADTGNARVEQFSPKGHFISAFGWGVADGKAQSEVCTNTCQAGIPGAGPGQFLKPTSIAVNGSTVLVGDAGNNVVDKFDTDGHLNGTIDGTTTPQGHFQRLAGVTVDQSGNLWTADGGTRNVDEFSPSGAFVRQWTDTHGSPSAIAVDSNHNSVYVTISSSSTPCNLCVVVGIAERWTLTGQPVTGEIDRPVQFPSQGPFVGSALALDSGTGNLYVDHINAAGVPSSAVTVYDPTGIQLDDLPLSNSNSDGLAIRSSTKALYLSDASNNNVTIYAPQTTSAAPLVTSESATQTGTTTATLNAGTVPLGHDTTCNFQYVDYANFNATGYNNATSVPCTPADLGSGFTYKAASVSVSGLTVGKVYHFRVVATSSAGTSNGADQEFQAGPGAWAPFSRCPVDDPSMLGTDGKNTIPYCLGTNSTHGTITIGNVTTTTGNTNLQDGMLQDSSTGTFSSVAPAGGSLIADPVQLSSPVGPVTAVTESAGIPSNFHLLAGLTTGVPLITIPVKIHLENPFLGPNCYIGSDQNPIVLNPQNTDLSNAKAVGLFFSFDAATGVPDVPGPDGSLLVTGAVQGDDTFSVPGATGCGANDSLDGAVDGTFGVPSPSGNNHLVLDDASSAVAYPQNYENGQAFAGDWHSAFG